MFTTIFSNILRLIFIKKNSKIQSVSKYWSVTFPIFCFSVVPKECRSSLVNSILYIRHSQILKCRERNFKVIILHSIFFSIFFFLFFLLILFNVFFESEEVLWLSYNFLTIQHKKYYKKLLSLTDKVDLWKQKKKKFKHFMKANIIFLASISGKIELNMYWNFKYLIDYSSSWAME